MIDIFSIQPGDIIEYGPYLCSESLQDKRKTGIYQDFMYWSPDSRPVEMWVNFIGENGLKMFTRASQITNVLRKEIKK